MSFQRDRVKASVRNRDLGFHVGHFVQYGEKALATASRCPPIQALPGGKLLSERRRDYIVDGQVPRFGKLPRLLVNRPGCSHFRHSVCLAKSMNSAGVRTMTRRFPASTKSLVLYVTIIPPHSALDSKIQQPVHHPDPTGSGALNKRKVRTPELTPLRHGIEKRPCRKG
jgi:hypothetical protein